MRRALSFTLIALFTALAAACGGGTTPPAEDAAKAENPCAQPAAPPKEGETPTCSEGCMWNGTACAQQRGIIVHDIAPRPRPSSGGSSTRPSQ